MKRNYLKSFLKGFGISMLFVSVPVLTFLGMCKAYEGMRQIAYGEKRSAIETIYGANNEPCGLKVLDFEITF